VADDPVSLLRPDTPEWKLWSLVAEFSSHLDPTQWALIGGQMVALHLHLAGEVPGRTTIDVDVVADLIAAPESFRACRAAAAAMDLVAQPSITGRNLHRFAGAAGQIDLMVADHLPSAVTRGFTRPAPVSIAGGQRALDRRVVVQIETEFGRGHVPLPDLVGALVLKARAAIADTRDRERHLTDLAQLASIINDPIGLIGALDKKERRALRRVHLSHDPTQTPWLALDEAKRQRSVDAWSTLAAG
jgi:predicted nucleotidyltransferase